MGFMCKIKDLGGIEVFSINNSSLIGDICNKEGCGLLKLHFRCMFTEVGNPPPPSATIHLFL